MLSNMGEKKMNDCGSCKHWKYGGNNIGGCMNKLVHGGAPGPKKLVPLPHRKEPYSIVTLISFGCVLHEAADEPL